jgi:Ca-activated chloride channel homolog
MKISLTIVVILFVKLYSFAQGDIEFAIAVIGVDNKPVSNLVLVAKETTSLKTISGKTGMDGKTVLALNDGKEWVISVGEMRNAVYVVPMAGRLTRTNRLFVYDLKSYIRKKSQRDDRSTDKFKIVTQSVTPSTQFKPGECKLAIYVNLPDGKALSNIKVDIINVKDSIVYTGTTNSNGVALFIVPNKRNYDIDVDGIKNFHYGDFGDEYATQNVRLIYLPTVTNEKIVNDTTYQDLSAKSSPSSERTLLRVFVSGGKKEGVGEQIFLRQVSTGKVFATTTNKDGYAYFLVPIKHIYMIDFKYEKDVDAVNLLHTTEVTTGNLRVRYNPDPRLEYPETFIPTPDRLLLKGFNDFLTRQFEKPKNKPFRLEIKSARRINGSTKEALFTLTLAGSDSYASVRLPLNAALVLDKSGSMFSDDRAESLKHSLLDIGSLLTAKDEISVILFDDNASEVQPSSLNHRENLKNISENYSPGGGTNIFNGLELATTSIKRKFNADRSNKIILLTDGYGIDPPKEITDYVEARFNEGIEFSAIGLGQDYNQSLLELIALKGNGTFSYVDQSKMLSDAFLKEINGSLNYSAKDLVVEIFHNEKLIFSNLFGFPTKTTSKEMVAFDVKKVPHNENRIAFLKFKLDKPTAEIEKTPLHVKVRYFDLKTKQIVQYEEQVSLLWTEQTDTELLLDQHEKELYAIAILNQSLKAMAEAYELMDSKTAKEALKSGKEQIEDIFPKAKPKDVRELFDEVVRYLQLFYQMEKNKK